MADEHGAAIRYPDGSLEEMRCDIAVPNEWKETLAAQVALALERIALSREVTRRNSEAYFRTLVQSAESITEEVVPAGDQGG